MWGKFLVIFLLILIALPVIATDYECEFDSRANINCQLVGAASSFCQLAGPGPVANNPAVATTCITNTPSTPGKVICTLRNYTGSANSIRCSNTVSLVSGPILVGGQANIGTNCPYNDCELNQISCASAYAFQQCVVDSSDPRCNKWQATNCVANAPCKSGTAAELAVCAGVPTTQIQSQNGLYFVSSTSGGTNPGSNPILPANQNNSGSFSFNGKTYYVVFNQ